MELYEYDPTKPPPEVIGITLEEYDNFKYALSSVLDLHVMIRRLSDYLNGARLTTEEVENLKEDLIHLRFVYNI